MKKLSWKKIAWIAVTVAALAVLTNFSPGYTCVRVSGPDGEVQVEKAGFGPQSVRVEQPGTRIECNTR
jgi:hypothetical protein